MLLSHFTLWDTWSLIPIPWSFPEHFEVKIFWIFIVWLKRILFSLCLHHHNWSFPLVWEVSLIMYCLEALAVEVIHAKSSLCFLIVLAFYQLALCDNSSSTLEYFLIWVFSWLWKNNLCFQLDNLLFYFIFFTICWVL